MRKFLLLFIFLVGGLNADELHKLNVTGSAALFKPADLLTMTVGVVTQNPQVKAALKANGEQMRAMNDLLKNVGLSQKELQTGTFTVVPQYATPPRNIPENWHPAIVSYEVRNTIAIKTTQLELVGAIIDAVAQAGANLVEDLNFTLLDQQPAKSEAIAQAVQQARLYADAAAKEADITLGDILELTINPAPIAPRPFRMEKFAMAAMDAGTPITPGEVEVNATVSLVYAIKSH